MDYSIKKLMDEQFGRHRGGLWRSEREYYVYASKDPQGTIKAVADNVAGKREGLHNRKGFSRKRNLRWMGDIPAEIAFANPELMTDPEAAREFFRLYPAFSSKG